MRPLACCKIPNSISVSALTVDRVRKCIYIGCSSGSLFQSSLVGPRELRQIPLERDSTGIVEIEVVDSLLIIQSRSGWIQVMEEEKTVFYEFQCSSLTFCGFKVTANRLIVFPCDGNRLIVVDLNEINSRWEISLANEREIGMITCLQILEPDSVLAATDAGFLIQVSLKHKSIQKTQKAFNGSSKLILY
jgi:hypothetical protein